MSTWLAESKTVSGQDSLLLEDLFYLLAEDNGKLVLDQAISGQISWSSTSALSRSWSATNKNSRSWSGPSKQIGSWSAQSKIGIDDLLALENGSDILGTEDTNDLGLEQSDSTGVTWSGTNKT